jgi:hypothetical protein
MSEQKIISQWSSWGTVPQDMVKSAKGKALRDGGYTGMYSINNQWRIEKLTERFGLVGQGWWTSEPDYETHDLPDGTIVVYCKLAMYYTIEEQGTFRTSNPIWGNGSSVAFAPKGANNEVSSQARKKAYTDAFSKCTQLLGIGSEVYYGEYGSDDDETPNNQANRQIPPPPPAMNRSAGPNPYAP